MGFVKKKGILLLCIWLLLYGLNILMKLNFEGFPYVMAILAIAAAVLLFLDR